MCGIAGIISTNTNEVAIERLQKMTLVIAHRGPDGEGHWKNEQKQVGLGHRRLSIIDLSAAGTQPMHYLNRYSIVHNGEIYNYIELRQTLQAKGYLFESQTDTEVILAAYACYGQACLQHFDGMFAFAIWDQQTQTLFAARDRFGEKPFFYHFDEQQKTLFFASEMKALWAAGLPKQTNNTMLLNYLSLGQVKSALDASLTFYENIFSLPAANCLTFHLSTNQLTIDRYWDVDKESTANISTIEAIEKFGELFQTSVEKRLRSDVPVGTSLSGGLDSSSIIAAMHQAGNMQLQTFSAHFPAFAKDEKKHIELVSQHFQLQSHFVEPSAENMLAHFDKVLYHQEEPVGSASVFAQWEVYALAKEKGVTVLLDGQGADEVLGGYHKYIHWFLQELIAQKQFAKAKNELNAFRNNGAEVDWTWRNYIAAMMPSLASNRLQKKANQQIEWNADLTDAFKEANYQSLLMQKPTVEKLNDILYFNTMQLGLEELLRYADRNSMAHGREVRLPFLNHELVQFVFSLPATMKMQEGFTKWILRATMQNQLPKEIVWRKDKIGFEPPQAEWMQHPMIVERLQAAKEKLVGNGILHKKTLQQKTNAKDAYAAKNVDWWYLCASII